MTKKTYRGGEDLAVQKKKKKYKKHIQKKNNKLKKTLLNLSKYNTNNGKSHCIKNKSWKKSLY